MIEKFLFPDAPSPNKSSLLLLWARIIIGLLFLNHGIEKWMSFGQLSETFPDPIGLGSTVSLILVIFAEVFCSFAFIFGIFYRLALLPMIFSMCIAFFIVHSEMPLASKELSLIYLIIFILMFIAGPGRFSADNIVIRRCCKFRKIETSADSEFASSKRTTP